LITDSNTDPRPAPLNDDLELTFAAGGRVQQGVSRQLRDAQDCVVSGRAACQRPRDEPPGMGYLLVATRENPPLWTRDPSIFPGIPGRVPGSLYQVMCRCPVGRHEALVPPWHDGHTTDPAPRITLMSQSSRTQQCQAITRRYHGTG
jgi:hypothetical protein